MIEEKKQQQYEGMLVSDFDGTISKYDFYDLACQAFPDIAGNFWAQYEAGEITHFEGLRRIFERIRAPEKQLLDIIKNMQIDVRTADMIELCRKNGWEVSIASAGCDWYIKKLLQSQSIDVKLHANHGEYIEGQGLLMKLPTESCFFSQEVGINKLSVVKDALVKFKRVAFAGDGRPDLAPALAVPGHFRFARHWLAKKLTELGEEFHPFENWSQVVLKLQQQEGWRQ